MLRIPALLLQIVTIVLVLNTPALLADSSPLQPPQYTVHLIPNTHGTIGGWLVNFDTERSYVLNNHLDHLERLAQDPSYTLAISEVPNVMAIMKFAPQKMEAVRRYTREGRVEFVNGFFLEPTVNLSGGEALAQMAVLGVRWYEQTLQLRPRFAWMIDVCGTHGQMPQIVAQAGLEALFFSRNNPMPKDAFWWVAPDGTRTLALALGPGYSAGRDLFNTAEPLSATQLEALAEAFQKGRDHSASARHLLMVAGGGDYSLAPRRASYPAEFLEAWKQRYPNVALRMATPGQYVTLLQEELKNGTASLDEYRGDAAYSYNAFWMNMPEVKRDYRRAEHTLQAAEMITAAASLLRDRSYPVQDFYHSWIQMLVNMDRNMLWGAASGTGFYDSHHWNAWDRFRWIGRQAGTAIAEGITALTQPGNGVTLLNPLNWKRQDPVDIVLPPGTRLRGVTCEERPGTDEARCLLPQDPTGIHSYVLENRSPEAVSEQSFKPEISTPYYTVRFDARNGSIISLRDRRTGREYLSGEANVIQAESVDGIVKDPTNWMAPRPMRKRVDSTATRQGRAQWQVLRGPVATTVIARTGLAGGSRVERRITLYHAHPRIDFETTIDNRRANTLLTVDFPLAGPVVERTRGVPFGFMASDPRASKPPTPYFLMADHRTYGFSDAIQPAVRWSDYSLEGGGGVALLDRGLTGHELNGNTLTLALVNAQESYRGLDNRILEGLGVRTLEYALWPHTGSWQDVEIPKRAWEYNTPVLIDERRQGADPQSWLETSSNVIVEAVRRTGEDLEVRLVEWSGKAGQAEIHLRLPHRDARLTNFLGEQAQTISGTGGRYRFPIRSQQIVTLRFAAGSALPQPTAIRDWAPVVPRFKRQPLDVNEPVRGYPSITRQPSMEDFGAQERSRPGQ